MMYSRPRSPPSRVTDRGRIGAPMSLHPRGGHVDGFTGRVSQQDGSGQRVEVRTQLPPPTTRTDPAHRPHAAPVGARLATVLRALDRACIPSLQAGRARVPVELADHVLASPVDDLDRLPVARHQAPTIL